MDEGDCTISSVDHFDFGGISDLIRSINPSHHTDD